MAGNTKYLPYKDSGLAVPLLRTRYLIQKARWAAKTKRLEEEEGFKPAWLTALQKILQAYHFPPVRTMGRLGQEDLSLLTRILEEERMSFWAEVTKSIWLLNRTELCKAGEEDQKHPRLGQMGKHKSTRLQS